MAAALLQDFERQELAAVGQGHRPNRPKEACWDMDGSLESGAPVLTGWQLRTRLKKSISVLERASAQWMRCGLVGCAGEPRQPETLAAGMLLTNQRACGTASRGAPRQLKSASGPAPRLMCAGDKEPPQRVRAVMTASGEAGSAGLSPRTCCFQMANASSAGSSARMMMGWSVGCAALRNTLRGRQWP